MNKITNKTILAATLMLCTAAISAAGARKSHRQASPYKGYIFAYFEGTGDADKQEHLRFAVSEDAKNWFALNKNRPVVSSDTISESGGIRDPHILRGEDGHTFYIVATDMNTREHGWKENPGIVLMKSDDLVNWTHAKINLSKDYPENFGDAYWVWAPQTIYDKKAGKYMIYFTLQRNDRKSLITYYAYANDDFTGFEGEPKVLFSAKYGSIDNDIIYKDGTYHLFYKGNTKNEEGKEVKNGIQQATSRSLLGNWKEDFKYVDSYAGTKTHVEGSSVFKLNDRDEYVLMYDLYSSGRYEYQTSKDLKTFTSKPQSFRKDFFPRHGTVTSLTAEELDRVQSKWGYVLKHDIESNGNPIFKHKFTADPAVLVHNDTLWLFTGEDFAGNQRGYTMKDWLVFSTTDMKHWTEYPVPLRPTDFSWAKNRPAYAGHVAERNGKFYWYVSTNSGGIGVAVANRPEGPYTDALGKPLLTKKDCFASTHGWACIDPAVFIDDDGQAYLFWGNRECYYVKLKENMIETDGDIHQVAIDASHPFTEAPWVHKYNGKYYLTYASEWPEKIAYAMADKVTGPYEVKGIISEIAGNSNTTHPAIVNFRDKWVFFSHNGGLPEGTSYSRSVVAEPMEYNPDGTIKKINPSTEGMQFKEWSGNPILPGMHADPEILYSEKTGRYYIYSTTDGHPGWGGWYFTCFSSDNLVDWRDEGIILDVCKDTKWASGNAWAPAIIEKKVDGQYKYFFYYSGNAGNAKAIGVAVADSPTGPFVDLGHPIVNKRPAGLKNGQQIDVDVFNDPDTGIDYLYWGNGYMAGARLNPDMTSIDTTTLKLMTPRGGSLSDYKYREAPYVFKRNGLYYFLWSVDDTGSPNYHVVYGTSKSPLGPIEVAKDPIILIQEPESEIYGPAHNSVLKVPGKDEWYIVYHRINKNYLPKDKGPGYHREVCIDKMEFNADGTIKRTIPTHKGIKAIK